MSEQDEYAAKIHDIVISADMGSYTNALLLGEIAKHLAHIASLLQEQSSGRSS